MTPLGPDANPQAVPYKILIAVAFDPTSESALLEGAKLARRTPGSELHIVYVASQSDDGGTLSLLPSADGPEPPAEALRRRVEFVWAQTGGMTVVAHIRSGDPAKEILQLAIDLAADLIVVGSHQRSGLQRLVLGSVAERVLHDSHCPVLRVVPKDYGDTVPSPRIEPALPRLPAPPARAAPTRSSGASATASRIYAPHIYVPRDEGASVDHARQRNSRSSRARARYASSAVTPSVIRLLPSPISGSSHADAAQQRQQHLVGVLVRSTRSARRDARARRRRGPRSAPGSR